MARFVQQKDLAFFEKISKELVDVVVQTTVEILNFLFPKVELIFMVNHLENHIYLQYNVACMIERDESVIDYEGFGPDRAQNFSNLDSIELLLEDKNLFH